MSKKVIIKSYNELSLAKPRISKRWLFSISGFLAPLTGIMGGCLLTAQWAIAVAISYSVIWGVAAIINAIGCCDDGIELFHYDPNDRDLKNTCKELLKENRLLKAENERLMEALEPQLIEGRKS